MARRSKSSAGASLDSLLDTMTNVVGILVIMLVVTQLGVGDAVDRISATDAVRLEVLEEAMKQAEKLRQQRELLEAQAKALDTQEPADPATLQQLKDQIARQQQAQQKGQQDKQKQDELQRLIDERRKKSKELEQQINQHEDELAKLRAQLDQTPVRTAPPPKVIHLPNPRAAPPGVQPQLFVCRHGRIAPIDVAELQGKAQLLIKKVGVNAKLEGGYDCQKMINVFNRQVVGDRFFRLKLKIINHNPYLAIEPQKNTGETAAQIRRPTSRYQRAIKTLDNKKFYARFMVWADSFDTYLEARQIATGQDVLAGWVPYDANWEWRVGVGGGIRCGKPKLPPGQQPPPKPPAPKHAPKKPPSDTPPKKPPPKDDID